MNNLIQIYLTLLLITTFLGCTNNAADSPYPDIVFTKVSTMPGSGRASAVAFIIADKAYITLGRYSTDSLKECWEYNSATNSWVEQAPFPGIARVKAMAATINGKAYVGLGYNRSKGAYAEGGNLCDFWEFDPQASLPKQWTRLADLPSKATNACVSFVYNNTLIVGGGFNGFGFTGEYWQYHPNNNTWTQLNNFGGIPRSGGVLSASAERVFYGTGYRTLNENDWWEYFTENDSWTKRKSMPDKGRINAVACAANNRYYVATGREFGGEHTGGHLKNDIMEYDALRNVWYKRGNIPASGRENAIVFCIGKKVYIGFGDNDTEILNDLWCFEE